MFGERERCCIVEIARQGRILIWKKIRPTRLRIDLRERIGRRKRRGPDTARIRLEESFGSACIQEFCEGAEFFA